jgi:glycosyltransferase involved in cell wall biosynthesis
MLVANSKFTAARFEKYYDANVDHVLYPPVDIHFQKGIKNPKRIVSLGRFAPHKRQLEQIQVFHELTDFEFYLIGFKNNEAYFNSLAAYIAEHKMTNVHLVADASEQERNDLLTSATYFIHALREEPFGITTVQGIAAGCLPLVHNSGGQREVVPFEELRYQHERDISERVRYIESKGTAEDLQAKLTAHIQAYESTTFRAEFKKLLDQKLPAK